LKQGENGTKGKKHWNWKGGISKDKKYILQYQRKYQKQYYLEHKNEL
jgi:hypothetical protein